MRYFLIAAVGFLVTGCVTLEANVKKHDFGTVYVGQEAASPNITWKNKGDDKVEVIGIKSDWSVGSPFSLQPRTYTAKTLSKNDVSNPVQVMFAPKAVGTYKGKLEPLQDITIGKAATARVVDIQGKAVAQVAKGKLAIGGAQLMVGKPLDFGSARVGANPGPSKRIDVVNTSAQAITVRVTFKSTSGEFKTDPAATTYRIPARGKVTIKLRFKPTAVGDRWDVVEFVDTANGKNVAGTALKGTGTE